MQNYLFEILFRLMAFWREQRNRVMSDERSAWCFVFLPFILFRHLLKPEDFNSFRISEITSASERPNWASIASKLVRSSQAISIMRSVAAAESWFACMSVYLEEYQQKPM